MVVSNIPTFIKTKYGGYVIHTWSNESTGESIHVHVTNSSKKSSVPSCNKIKFE